MTWQITKYTYNHIVFISATGLQYANISIRQSLSQRCRLILQLFNSYLFQIFKCFIVKFSAHFLIIYVASF